MSSISLLALAGTGRRPGAATVREGQGLAGSAEGAKLEEELNRLPRVSGDSTTGQGVYVTQRLNKLLVKAQDEAKKLKDEYVSVEHLVLAMFDEPASHRHRQNLQDAQPPAR